MTSNVLPRLRQWAPEIAAKLSEKDALAQMPFKLITTSRFWTSTDIHSFVALSYCWQSQEWEVPSRFNPEQQHWDFPISPAMLQALFLQFFVKSSTTSHCAIWTDQICIDQDNANEEFRAIANLDTIYRNAAGVNILLEDLDISIEEESALRLGPAANNKSGPNNYLNIRETQIFGIVQGCVVAGSEDALVSVIIKVFESRWFTRAWCRHEYMLNPNSTFIVVGRHLACIAFDPSIFAEAHGLLVNNEVDMDFIDLTPTFQDFSFGVNDRIIDFTTEGCLFELFVQLQHLDCSYERDIIPVSLNASGIRLSFKGDAASQRECRYILAMIALSAGDASVLGAEGAPMSRMDTPGHQALLSWPREYDMDWSIQTMMSMPRICDDAKIWAITAKKASLDILLLLSRPSTPPREFMESAAELSSSLETMTEVSIDILSCVFSFGFEWIIRASEHFKGSWSLNRDIDGSRYLTIMSTITRHCPSNGYILSHGFPDASRIVDFIYDLSTCDHNWFANVEETTVLTMSLNSNSTGQAILLVPKSLASQVSCGKYHIAVPVALNTIQAFSVRRVWILEAARTDEAEFALVGRGFFIADSALNTEEHDEICYRQRVTIVGQWRDDQFSEDDSSFEL